MSDPSKDYIGLTANIVSAYVSNNVTPASDIPALINQVHAALVRVSNGQHESSPELARPAVPVKRSVTSEYLVCLEDGKKFKSMKSHLANLGMTPDQYRRKWDLPDDYPIVAPNYAASRSELAKKFRLGRKPKAAETNDAAE